MKKRIGLTIAIVIAVLIIGLLGWRFWPQPASSVMSVSEDTITSFAAYGMLDSFERRMARQLFKQSVEISKIFWLIVKEMDINPEDADTLHASCTDEVKKINGAIQFPYNAKDDN